MKRLMAMLLTLVLIAGVPALAETGLGAHALAAKAPYETDLDGDGTTEAVSWATAPDAYGEDRLTLTVTSADGEALTYQTEIIWNEGVFVMDIDGDGAQELLLTGDVMSDDYVTYCLRYVPGALYEVLFPDSGRGDNGDGYYKCGYGLLTDAGDGKLVLTGTQDVLGTWMASRTVAMAVSGHFEFADDGLWLRDLSGGTDEMWDYAALTLKAALAWSDLDGQPAGMLRPGDKILITASDKVETARFITPDGAVGALAISPDYEKGWGLRVNGQPEDELFELLPYAD